MLTSEGKKYFKIFTFFYIFTKRRHGCRRARTISTFFFASFVLRPAIKVALRWAKPISHNVPAVSDVFLRPIKETAQAVSRAQKNVAEESRIKARSADCGFL